MESNENNPAENLDVNKPQEVSESEALKRTTSETLNESTTEVVEVTEKFVPESRLKLQKFQDKVAAVKAETQKLVIGQHELVDKIILAIFAEMKGAKPLEAIDIDSWCYENSLENIERNNCHHIAVYKGDASLLKGKKYDVIIANINRNILLSDMKTYTDCLNEKGLLLLSGFYKEDFQIINKQVVKYGLTLDSKLERNNWLALKYLM